MSTVNSTKMEMSISDDLLVYKLNKIFDIIFEKINENFNSYSIQLIEPNETQTRNIPFINMSLNEKDLNIDIEIRKDIIIDRKLHQLLLNNRHFIERFKDFLEGLYMGMEIGSVFTLIILSNIGSIKYVKNPSLDDIYPFINTISINTLISDSYAKDKFAHVFPYIDDIVNELFFTNNITND